MFLESLTSLVYGRTLSCCDGVFFKQLHDFGATIDKCQGMSRKLPRDTSDQP